MIEVTVYSKPKCYQCKATTKKLDALKIPYTYHDITEDPKHASVVKFLGYSQAPVVLVGDIHWSGYSPDKLNRLAEILKSDHYAGLENLDEEFEELEQRAQEYLRKEMGL